MNSPFFKDLRRCLREACSEKLESLSTQLCVSSDIELARCLNTNVRKIRDIRHRGSLCALTELCEKACIEDMPTKELEYSIKSVENIKYYCPFCKKIMQTWYIGRNGKQVASSPEPLIIDGDTVYGVDTGLIHTIGWTEDDPCYWGMELLRPCASCKKEGFFVFANCMSKKYTYKAYQNRLMFNTQVGEPEYIKANLNQHTMHHIDSWHQCCPAKGQ